MRFVVEIPWLTEALMGFTLLAAGFGSGWLTRARSHKALEQRQAQLQERFTALEQAVTEAVDGHIEQLNQVLRHLLRKKVAARVPPPPSPDELKTRAYTRVPSAARDGQTARLELDPEWIADMAGSSR